MCLHVGVITIGRGVRLPALAARLCKQFMSLFEFALAAVHLVAYSDSSTGMCGVSVAVAIFCIVQLWQAALCPSKL